MRTTPRSPVAHAGRGPERTVVNLRCSGYGGRVVEDDPAGAAGRGYPGGRVSRNGTAGDVEVIQAGSCAIRFAAARGHARVNPVLSLYVGYRRPIRVSSCRGALLCPRHRQRCGAPPHR